MPHSLLTLIILGLHLLSCHPQLALAPQKSHAQMGNIPVAVPYPPPPARARFIPPKPSEQALWVDGYWRFERGNYRWRKGRWVSPAENFFFAPPKLIRKSNGSLYYYSGRYGKPNARPAREAATKTAD